MAQRDRTVTPQAEGWLFESQTYVVKPGNAISTAKRSAICVSRFFGDDHHKRMPLVIVGVTRVRALKEPMSAEHIDQNLQPFTGNNDVSNE